MGLWAFYFFAKVFLALRGHIQVHVFLNLLLAIFLCVPVPKAAPRRRLLSFIKGITGAVLAFLLLWYDSWLPSLSFVLRFARSGGATISPHYLLNYFEGYFNPWDAAALLEILAVCVALRKRWLLTAAAFLSIALLPLRTLGARRSDALNGVLATFYRTQSQEVVRFPRKPDKPAFDIVFIHVCSLSWDDLKTAGYDKAPFFDNFDLLLTKYNGVSSYSGQSAIRLLRSPCGQTSNPALLQSAPPDCYLLDDLHALGYKTFSAWDHPGSFDLGGPWKERVETYGHADPPRSNDGLAVVQYGFDDEPIRDDYDVLDRWWKQRLASKAEREFLFFNTITLHGGTHLASEKEWWTLDRVAHYRRSLDKLFAELDRFFAEVNASGRDVVVVFVPEHGRALRGSVMQAPDTREIPLPEVTLVPVGVRLLGKDAPARRGPVVVDTPTGQRAIAYLLSSFLAEPPFNKEGISAAAVRGIPRIPFVAENDEDKVMSYGGRYYYFGKDKLWTPVPTSVLSLRAAPYLGKRLLSWLEHRSMSMTDLAATSTGAKVEVSQGEGTQVYDAHARKWVQGPETPPSGSGL